MHEITRVAHRSSRQARLVWSTKSLRSRNGSTCVSECKRFKIAIERTPLSHFYVLQFTCALFHEFREALNAKF
jgi:hypothetical protein